MVSPILSLLLLLLPSSVVLAGEGTKKKAEAKFRAVEPDYNSRLQEACGNVEFTNSAVKRSGASTSRADQGGGEAVEERIMGGKMAPRGKHPWAVTSVKFTMSDCSGALISKRHILTSRACLEEYPKLYKPFPVHFLVGGVCQRNCIVWDMREVHVDLAAYTSLSPNISNNDEDDQEDWGLGILQLSEDLDKDTPFGFLGLFSQANLISHMDTFQSPIHDTSPICLPTPEMHLPPASEPMTVYGWGPDEMSGPEHKHNNNMLYEVEIPYLNESDSRYTDNFTDWCNDSQRKLICLGDSARQKYAIYEGDVGGGVLAWRHNVSLPPLLFGSVVHSYRALLLNVTLAASLLRPQLGYAICYYTGVCVKREWEQRRQAGEEPEEKFDVVFDPNDAPDRLTDSTPSTTVAATATAEKTTTEVTTRPHPLPDDNVTRLLALFGELAKELWMLFVHVLWALLNLFHSIAATP